MSEITKKAQKDSDKQQLDKIDEVTMLKEIKRKLIEKNIPIETFFYEFERLEDLEDKISEKIHVLLEICVLEKLESNKINDKHYQYYNVFENYLHSIEKLMEGE